MKILDVVKLLVDSPDDGLAVGAIGTILLVHDNPAGIEVEFTDQHGRTIAQVAVKPEDLELVHHFDG